MSVYDKSVDEGNKDFSKDGRNDIKDYLSDPLSDIKNIQSGVWVK